MTVRVGVFGTSWWADSMYLPPLTNHPDATVVAVCGRREDPAQAFAAQWNIPQWFIDPDEMFNSVELDAVVIATANDSHYPLALQAMKRGLHVLCEKPLGLNTEQTADMAAAAADAAAITMVPFTYRYMPVSQWVRQLVEEGFVGRPFHANLRYYTGFGLDPSYSWRFDREIAGSGIIGDIGSHFIDLSRWLLGDTETSISCTASTFTEREPRPDGSDYERLEDSAAMTIRYRSGAYSMVQVSSVCWEGTPFGQTHHLEIHGDDGTIYATNDWGSVQEVRGLKRDQTGAPTVLPIPDDIWNGVRRDTVHNTYRDTFRDTDVMTRAWVSGIRDGHPVQPDFATGHEVQRVLDAAVASAEADGCAIQL